MSNQKLQVTCPTPAFVLARLHQDPGPGPMGFTVLTGEDTTLGLLNSGDALGIDGRWCPVVRCNSVNGWVEVETPAGYPVLPAVFEDVRVHLARVIDEPEVAP